MGLENALDLPHAATLCGACSVVCPVKIPLPGLLRSLRERQVKARLRPCGEMLALKLWSFAGRRPLLYAFLSRWGARVLRLFWGRGGMISSLPLAAGWTKALFFQHRRPAAPSATVGGRNEVNPVRCWKPGTYHGFWQAHTRYGGAFRRQLSS